MFKKKQYICLNCNHVGYPKLIQNGSKKTEIFWWVVATPIAIIYSIYRRVGSKKICENCGSDNLLIYAKKN
ncbi:MAG: hypothetical protein ACKOXJ_01065 [Alphaproteobacteria bacterium]